MKVIAPRLYRVSLILREDYDEQKDLPWLGEMVGLIEIGGEVVMMGVGVMRWWWGVRWR
jgi:hypothetical protein